MPTKDKPLWADDFNAKQKSHTSKLFKLSNITPIQDIYENESTLRILREERIERRQKIERTERAASSGVDVRHELGAALFG